VFLKVGGIAPLGAVLMGKGKKKRRGRNYAKVTKILNDHCVNFSSLLL